MDMTLKKKLLLTLLLFLFTTSFFEGMISKSLANCQEPSRRNHIKFVMTLTEALFQVCLLSLCRILFTWNLYFICSLFYNDLLFVLVSVFYLHGNFEGNSAGQLNLQFLLLIDAGCFSTESWINWFVLQSFLCAWLMLHVFDY